MFVKINHLKKRGGVYQFRARIPSHLVEVVGTREHQESLKTRDESEAKRRLAV